MKQICVCWDMNRALRETCRRAYSY